MLKVLIKSFSVLAILSTCALANADWLEDKSIFIGTGVGANNLKPDTTNSGYQVVDETDVGWKLYSGIDWNDDISAEIYYADLGSIKFKPSGRLHYQVMGADVIYNFWLKGSARRKNNFALYLKGGINHIKNKSSGLDYSRESNVQLNWGIGGEYYFPKKISFRVELESYGADAALVSIGLVKRFGLSKLNPENTFIRAAEQLAVEDFSSVDSDNDGINDRMDKCLHSRPGVPVAQDGCLDSDRDGISQAQDKCPTSPSYSNVNRFGCGDKDNDGIFDFVDNCPNSARGVNVSQQGCAAFEGVLNGIKFASNSSDILPQSLPTLDVIVEQLNLYKTLQVSVQAHTDSQGGSEYNLELSQRRSNAVKNYFIKYGIKTERLEAIGFGESKSVASNDTELGRAHNRRVELVVREN